MVRMSMNELTTFSWTFDEDVERYVAAGYEGIGVWRPKLTDFGEERGIDLLIDSGLRVSNLLWAGGFTGSDGRGYEDSIQDGIEAIYLASAMRAECLVVYSGSKGGHIYTHARRMTRGALRELIPVAQRADVTLALEPVHVECEGEWTILHNLEETVDFIGSLGSRHVKLAFDTYQLGHAGLHLGQVEKIAPMVAVVHLADSKHPPKGEQNRCLLGEGTIPIGEIIAALQEGGFNGFYDVELMGEDVEACDYEHILNQSRTAVGALISA